MFHCNSSHFDERNTLQYCTQKSFVTEIWWRDVRGVCLRGFDHFLSLMHQVARLCSVVFLASAQDHCSGYMRPYGHPKRLYTLYFAQEAGHMSRDASIAYAYLLVEQLLLSESRRAHPVKREHVDSPDRAVNGPEMSDIRCDILY